ncbi:hypothetical protein FBU31_001666 [Coemansia sp. 'formosensis']|nr:hypothetical protein FBU31_001666 [Coemansia sp. 'formosensis']
MLHSRAATLFRHTSSEGYATGNSTLGFHKILVLNTPIRHDRRHTMEAQGRFHKLSFDYTRTFGPPEANRLALEQGYLINGTHLACYLSHLHAYKRMVAENIETALILEDDVDMELDIRERLAPIMARVHEKYGGDWDMLFVGHCTFDANEPGDLPYWGPPGRGPELYVAEYPMCMHAYAVTRECARRLAVVLEERLKTVGHDIDLVLAIGVQFGMSTVLGVSPPPIVQVGKGGLPSDLRQPGEMDTGQRLDRSTLFHLGLRTSDPRLLPQYIEWAITAD